MQTITIANQKGGIAKTTTAINLAYGIAQKGFNTLLIDLDSQSNATFILKAENSKADILQALQKGTIPSISNASKNLDIISAQKELNTADFVLKDRNQLKNMISNIKGYDYCIIDTPPAINQLTICSLIASNYLVIPCQADILSLKGIIDLADNIKAVKQFNKSLCVLGAVITRYNQRTTLAQTIRADFEKLEQQYNIPLYKSIIRENTAIKESQYLRTCLFDYAPKSNGAKDYKAFIEETMKGIKQNEKGTK